MASGVGHETENSGDGCRRSTPLSPTTSNTTTLFKQKCGDIHVKILVYWSLAVECRCRMLSMQIANLEDDNNDLRRELDIRMGEMDDLQARIRGVFVPPGG